MNIHTLPIMLRKTHRAACLTYKDEADGLRIAKQQVEQKLADSLATHHRAQNQTHLLGASLADMQQALEHASQELDQLKSQWQLTMSFAQTFVNDANRAMMQVEEGVSRINADAARFK